MPSTNAAEPCSGPIRTITRSPVWKGAPLNRRQNALPHGQQVGWQLPRNFAHFAESRSA
jgi:hypothetical protein